MTELTDIGEIVDSLNRLLDWTGKSSEFKEKIQRDYVSWKIPFPRYLLENTKENRAIRNFCVHMLLAKCCDIVAICKKLRLDVELVRPYVVLTEPNLFNSEVGVAFSEEKWDVMLFRNVKTETYTEITSVRDRTLNQAFGPVVLPNAFSIIYVDHKIEDVTEDIFFNGGMFALWQNVWQEARVM